MKKGYSKKHNRLTEEWSHGQFGRNDTTGASVAFHWAEALKRLDRKQKDFAKKAINDVLREAKLGNLSKYSVKINTPLVEIPSSSETPFPTSCSSYAQIFSPKRSYRSFVYPPSPRRSTSHSSFLPSSSSSAYKTSTSCPICSHSTILFRPASCCQKAHSPCRFSHTSLAPLPALSPGSQSVMFPKSECVCKSVPKPSQLPTSAPGPTSSSRSIEIPKKKATCMIPFSPCPPCSLTYLNSPPISCASPRMVDKQLSPPSFASLTPPRAPSPLMNGVKFSPSSFTCPTKKCDISTSHSCESLRTPTYSNTLVKSPTDSCSCPNKLCQHSQDQATASSPQCSIHTLVDFPSPKCSCGSIKKLPPISHSKLPPTPQSQVAQASFSPVLSPYTSKERFLRYSEPSCLVRVFSPGSSPISSSSLFSPSLVVGPNNTATSLAAHPSPVFSALDEHIRKVLRFPEIDAYSDFRLNVKQHCPTPSTKEYLRRFNRFIFRGLHHSGKR